MSTLTSNSISSSRTPLLARPSSETIFVLLAMVATTFAILVLMVLLIDIVVDSIPRLNSAFFTNFPSRRAGQAGIASALAGSGVLMILVACIAVPLGVGAAIYLEEYAKRNWFTRVIELNITNLAGVPSVIYGLLGLQIFVRFAGFDRSLLSGALTLTIVILPVIILASREALRTVPRSLRDASIALGASKWKTVREQVLPVAMPGILTGCILSFSRAIGETAPLVMMGALTYVAFLPDGVFSAFTALPIQAFNWISRPQQDFHANAAAAILVLLVVLLSLNALAIFLRMKMQKRSRF